MKVTNALTLGDLTRVFVQHDARSTRRIERDFDRAPGGDARANAQRFQHRFLGGKARGQTLGLGVGVSSFSVGEESIEDARTALYDEAKTININNVDADPGRDHYSTVTVLARLRGRSTLRPSPRAMA